MKTNSIRKYVVSASSVSLVGTKEEDAFMKETQAISCDGFCLLTFVDGSGIDVHINDLSVPLLANAIRGNEALLAAAYLAVSTARKSASDS